MERKQREDCVGGYVGEVAVERVQGLGPMAALQPRVLAAQAALRETGAQGAVS